MYRDLAIPPVGMQTGLHPGRHRDNSLQSPLLPLPTGMECFPAELDTASFATVHLPCGQPA